MSPLAVLKAALKESRGARRRMLFLTICLAIGVSAVVAVAGLGSAIESGVRSESRRLLAGDLAVSGRNPLPDRILAEVDPGGQLRRTEVIELTTMAAAASTGQASTGELAGPTRLVELKAIGALYPFYGALTTAPTGIGPEQLGDGGVLVAPELLETLALQVGSELRLGGTPFRVVGTVSAEPDRLAAGVGLGPRVIVTVEGLERSGLLGFGSRVSYRTLIQVPGASIADAWSAKEVRGLADELRDLVADDDEVTSGSTRYRVETHLDAQPALRTGIDRIERFLALAALLSLLLGALGAGQAARAWVEERRDSIAIRRALGQRPREVMALYLVEATLLGLAGGVLGAVVGTLVQGLAPSLLPESLAVVASWAPQPSAILRGIALGLLAAFAATLGPLVEAGRVPPLRALRGDVEPPPPSGWQRVAIGAVILAALWVAALLQTGSVLVASAFTAGLVLLSLLLVFLSRVTGRGLAALAGTIRNPALRHGLTAPSRPGARTTAATVALGLGVVLTLGGALVGDALGDAFGADVPQDAPTAFLLDIQPAQLAGVQEILESGGGTDFRAVPVVTARFRTLDGDDVRTLSEGATGDRRWALTREQRLTWGELPEDNRIVAGALWQDPEPEVSIEVEFAAELGVVVGSHMTVDIQGVPVELKVTSLRTVDWRTFGINFFLVAEPGVLNDAPHTVLATAILPLDQEAALQNQLVATYPNVSLIKIREVLRKVTDALSKLETGIRALSLIVVLAGAAVLAGATASQGARRATETALLKTLGMTRAQAALRLAAESAAIGLVAGAVGVFGGNLLAWLALTRGFAIEWSLRPGAALAALVVTTALAIITGTLAAARALSARPIETLRRT